MGCYQWVDSVLVKVVVLREMVYACVLSEVCGTVDIEFLPWELQSF